MKRFVLIPVAILLVSGLIFGVGYAGDPEEIRIAITQTDMVTPLGRIKFGPDGQNHEVKGGVVQWLGGKQQLVYPWDVATVDVVYPMPTWAER